MEISGHIKIGGQSNGLPAMLGSFSLTKTSKKDENFEVISSGEDTLKVSLPWVFNPKENFKVGLISFIVINHIYKYRAEYVEGDDVIYLYPIQPFFNRREKLPVIQLEAKTWINSLNLKMRAIGYFYIGDKLFDFKTESKFTIENFEEELEVLNGISGDILAQCDITLNYKTKLFKSKNSDSVTYVSMESLSPRELLKSNHIEPKVVSSLKRMETIRLKEMESAKKKAISLEDAAKILGSISIELDTIENDAFSTDILEKIKIQKSIEEKKESVREEKKAVDSIISKNSDQLDLLIGKGLNQGLSKALIKKFKEEAYMKCEEVDFEIAKIIKLLR